MKVHYLLINNKGNYFNDKSIFCAPPHLLIFVHKSAKKWNPESSPSHSAYNHVNPSLFTSLFMLHQAYHRQCSKTSSKTVALVRFSSELEKHFVSIK